MRRRVLTSFPLRMQVEYLQVTLRFQGRKTGWAFIYVLFLATEAQGL